MVLDLKIELRKTKEETQLAREAAEAEKRASYQLGVEETQVRLTKKLSKMCKDYCNVTWEKALSIAGVPIDSVWRLPESVYYHPEIYEVSTPISSPPAHALDSSEQPLAIPDALPHSEISKGSGQASDQGQEVEREKGKGKGKGKKLFARSKDAAKEKEAEAKAQGADPQAKDVPTSQPSQKEDPPTPPAEA